MVQQLLKGAILSIQNNVDRNANYYFDVIQEHSISLSSQITDNWMENNTVIGDHIANTPTIISLRGLSAELVYLPSDTITGSNEFMTTTKLGVLTQLYPPADNILQRAKNKAASLENSANRYLTMVSNLISPTSQIRLKEIYKSLNKLRENKTSLTVETPFQNFEDMYIQSLTVRQGNQNYITDIELTLKQVYFASSQTTKADEKVVADIQNAQRAAIENHGNLQGVDTDSTLWYQWLNRSDLRVKIRGNE